MELKSKKLSLFLTITTVNWAPSVIQSSVKLQIPVKNVEAAELSLSIEDTPSTPKAKGSDSDIGLSELGKGKEKEKEKGKEKGKGSKVAEKMKKSKLPLVNGDAGRKIVCISV